MADSEDRPYQAEYAKSGRASCKGCKSTIAKDTLRLAIMVQSPMFDGKVPHWYHFVCFFGRTRAKSTGDIAHFDQLRWEDQQKIKEKVDGGGASLLAQQTSSNEELKDFSAAYSKSNRSVCRVCNEKIAKGVVRISKKDFDGERSKLYGPQEQWHHVDCFAKNRDDLDFLAGAERLPGFNSLSAEDKEMLKEKLPQLKTAGKRAAPSEPKEAKRKKKEPEEDKKLREQIEQIFKFRDQLKEQLSKKELQYLLEFNDQDIPAGESRMLDRLADCMAFGPTLPCEECKGGQLIYEREGYRCHGDLTEWTKCTSTTKTPKRKPFVVPDDLKESYSFLKKYKYVKQTRLFPASPDPPSTKPSTSGNSVNSASTTKQPLAGMKFSLGKTNKAKAEITKAIENLGGKVVTKVDKSVAAVISTKDDVEKMSKKIKEAKAADIHVISESYLDAVKNGGAVILITQNSICNWGSDPHDRLGDQVDSKLKNLKKKAEDSMFTKSMPAKMKMTVKGGAAVDPDSGLENKAHVLEASKDEIYNAVLGLVDIVRGTNSYYKLQLLESDVGKKYWLFRSWGRVGTTIGGNKVENMDTKHDALDQFKALYEEKTGNRWSDRSKFVKYPSRFYPLDIDYGQEDESIKKLSELRVNSKSKLAKSVQDLICMIFDVESMKKAMVEFEIDLKKMPLGKLSRRQIESAYSILTELQQLIQTGGVPSKFLDASNRFYTLIPHDFGMRKPPPLDNEELIKQKIDMLDNLLEIEVAYSLLKGADSDTSKDPIDVHYERLKTDIEVLDNKDEEFKRIQEYVKNTHAATHNQYDLQVVEAFKISRHGEGKRYKPFKKLNNRQLLWHGSRVTNFAGILSQGLRIAPPEAPATGYMFGKGIYFADMVSKSANYCHTSEFNPIGLMMLCEVALGNMHELLHADFVTQLPTGKHSTKGVGRTQPDPAKKYVTPDGMEIPMGPGVPSTVKNTSLLYNEYIVYDIAQVNAKYLLKMDFKWKF